MSFWNVPPSANIVLRGRRMGLIYSFCWTLSYVLILTGQDSGSKAIPASLGTTQPQQEKVGSPPGQPTVQVELSLHGFFLVFSIMERKWPCHLLLHCCCPALPARPAQCLCVHKDVLTEASPAVRALSLTFVGWTCPFCWPHVYSAIIFSWVNDISAANT